MHCSVIVIGKDQLTRLRLTLAGLEMQSARERQQVIVVDDGSNDGSAAWLAQYDGLGEIEIVSNGRAVGRSASRNAGAARARGDVLLFLDADSLPAPDVVALHLALHERAVNDGETVLGRGENHHLHCTRFFADPERGVPFAEHKERVAKMGEQLARSLVTREQVRRRFDEVAERGEPGPYPGGGPRKLYDEEMSALANTPQLGCLWMAASADNQSFSRAAFEAQGGFDEALSINEHRELALRICERGGRVRAVSGARSYHLTDRVGRRDPALEDRSWERRFYELHPSEATKLMAIFWQSLADDEQIPQHARINTLAELDAIIEHGSDVDYDAIRRAHPLLEPLP